MMMMFSSKYPGGAGGGHRPPAEETEARDGGADFQEEGYRGVLHIPGGLILKLFVTGNSRLSLALILFGFFCLPWTLVYFSFILYLPLWLGPLKKK